MADLSGMAAIDQIMAKMNPPKNPAPLGKRIVSELQRKQLAGLDDKRRSLDSTLASLKSPNTSQMSHDSLLATPLRGPKGGAEFVPRQDRFLERLKANRALHEKIEKNIGPCDRHQKFKPPPVKLDDTSCSSADEAEHNTTAEQENKETTMNETFELAAGSQGRKGQGCSTPRHVNNTLAPLRQIDISAVSMDSNRPGARSSVDLPAADAVEERMEVDEPEEAVNNVFALFGAKASQSQKKDEVKGNTLPAEENLQGGTFTIGKVDTNGTFTVQEVKSTIIVNDNKDKSNGRDEEIAAADGMDVSVAANVQAKIGNQTNEKIQSIGDGTFVVDKNAEKNLAAGVSIKDKTVIVSDEQPGPSNRSESQISFNKKCPGQKRQPMNSLLHNLSTMPSPASKNFGFVQRPFKRPNVKTPTRKGNKNTEIEDQEKTIEMSKFTDNEPSINGDDSSMVDPVTDPREQTSLPPETTPKRSISRMSCVSRISKVSTPQTPRSSDRPHYAKPTIAFRKKCIVELDDSSETEKTLSFHDPIDPSQMMMPNPSKSGFRPRAETGRSRFINTLHEMNRSLAGQLNATEDRRKQYMDRRVNSHSIQARASTSENSNISQPVLVPPPDIVTKPIPVNGRRSSEAVVENVRQSVIVYEDPSTEDLHRSAERLVINDEREASVEQNATATAIIGAVVPLQSPIPLQDPIPPVYNGGGYDSDDNVAGAYDDMMDDTLDQREKTNARLVSLFSLDPDTPVHHRNRHEFTMNSTVEEDSMVEEIADIGKAVMVLKPRKLIIPATPEQPGLRRSTRNRMAPVRTYLGEKPVYKNSPSGARLVGTNRVLISDPQYVKAKTTDPVKVIERQKKKADKKKKLREHNDAD